jgi:LysM repeat protein
VRRIALLALALVAAAGAPHAAAGERRHVVQAGESASAIAEREYGDRRLGDLLLAYNERRGTVIRAGETLRVPFCEVHRVRAGDSWSALTKKYMNDASGWRAVARLNGLAPDEPLRVGQELVFPVVLETKLERGATLATLAERYYDDPARGRLLQEFNDLDDPRRLAAGATVRVPLTTFRQRASAKTKPPAPTPAPVAVVVPTPKPAPPVVAAPPTPAPTPSPEPTPPVSIFGADLASAEDEFRRGAFDDAIALLEELREPVTLRGTEAERRSLLRLLAFVYVAFDNAEEACAAYGALTRIETAPVLDPDLVSPKIRQLLAACVSPA